MGYSGRGRPDLRHVPAGRAQVLREAQRQGSGRGCRPCRFCKQVSPRLIKQHKAFQAPRRDAGGFLRALSGATRQLSQRESPWHVGQVYAGRAKHDVSGTVVRCCQDSRQLDKVRCPEAAGLCSKSRAFAPYRASGVQLRVARPAKASPFGSNGDDRRQRRKQGEAVGAAASRMRAAAKQTLGAATRAVSPKVTERASPARKSRCAAMVRFPFVQPLSLATLDSSPSRGASGEEGKLCGMPKPPLLGEVARRQA